LFFKYFCTEFLEDLGDVRVAVPVVVGHDPVQVGHVHQGLSQSGEFGELFAPGVGGGDEINRRTRVIVEKVAPVLNQLKNYITPQIKHFLICR